MSRLKDKWTVTHVITERCNLNCSMCFQSNLRAGKNEELSFEKIKNFYMQHHKSILAVNITGGEPFVRSDCIELIEFIDSLKLVITINTNGTLLTPEIIDRLARLNRLRSLNISIDGPKEIHECIRNKTNIYDKIIRAVNYLSEKVRRKAIQVNTMIMPEIIPHLENHISFLESQGINHMELIFPGSYCQEELSCSRNILDNYGLLNVTIDTASKAIYKDISLRSVQDILSSIKNHPQMRISVVPSSFLNNPPFFLEDAVKNFSVSCDKIKGRQIRIDSKGQVVLCDTLRVSLAKYSDLHNLDEYLLNPVFIKLKQAIKEGLPCCKRCCKSSNLVDGAKNHFNLRDEKCQAV